MGKKYVFWRRPDGKLCKSKEDNDRYARKEILASLGQLLTTTRPRSSAVGNANGLYWPAFSWERHKWAIRSAITVLAPTGQELNEEDSWAIVWAAITTIVKRSGGGTPLSPSELLAEADNAAATYFRKPQDDFVMVTSLSIDEFPAKRIRIGDCEVSPLKTRGGRFPYPDVVKSHASGSPFAEHIRSSDYMVVKVTTDGRSVHEAVDKALDALNLVRGLWTLAAIHGSWSIGWGSMKQRTIGVVHIGPIHTLHKPDGTPIEHLYWFDPQYMGDRDLFAPKRGWGKIEAQRRQNMRRLKKLPYGRYVENLVVRYVEALDHPDFGVAFQHMWGVLEKLTDTVGARYDETVRRATAIFEDRKTVMEMLESLRLCRNRYVHAGQAVAEPDQIVYMVKQFVEPHLLQLIYNTFEVQSLEEYAEYLAITRDADTLDKRLRQFRKVRRTLRK